MIEKIKLPVWFIILLNDNLNPTIISRKYLISYSHCFFMFRTLEMEKIIKRYKSNKRTKYELTAKGRKIQHHVRLIKNELAKGKNLDKSIGN